MNSRLLFFLFIFSSSQVFAYSIDKVSYDRSTQGLEVSISYNGGDKKHEFSNLFEPCVKDTDPYQLAIRMIDTGWDDAGTKSISETVHIDLTSANCSPAEVTVFLGNRHSTIFID